MRGNRILSRETQVNIIVFAATQHFVKPTLCEQDIPAVEHCGMHADEVAGKQVRVRVLRGWVVDIVPELGAICSNTDMTSVHHRGIRRSGEAIETSRYRVWPQPVVCVEEDDELS
jgi:hypothetical protein